MGYKMRGAVFWFLVLISSSAAAQPISDTELQAGYCLGVSTSQAEAKTAELREEASDPILMELDQGTLGEIQERQKRFQDYLSAKGYTRDRSPEALRIASERGKKDVATCAAELEHEFYKECDDRCDKDYEPGTDANSGCLDTCPSPDSCERVKKCLGNFLPF
jgi:hypothetical protein